MSTHNYSLRKRESPANSPSPKRGYKKRKEQKSVNTPEVKEETEKPVKKTRKNDVPSLGSDDQPKDKEENPVDNKSEIESETPAKKKKKTTAKKSTKKTLFKKAKRSKSDKQAKDSKSESKKRTPLQKRRKKPTPVSPDPDSIHISDCDVPHETPPQRRLTFKTASVSKIGDREENQDAFIILDQLPVPLFAVFDGHGPLGQRASKDACKLLINHTLDIKTPLPPADVTDKFIQVYKGMHSDLITAAKKTKEEFGTTAVIAGVANLDTSPTLVTSWSGDSRAILCRQDKIIMVTNDHKLTREDELKRVTGEGGIISEGRNGTLRVTPNRTDYPESQIIKLKLALNMTRSLGHPILSRYGVTGDPEFCTVSIEEGDILVLASDGLWEIMGNEEVAGFIRLLCDLDLNAACKELGREVEKRGRIARVSLDNITIVLVKFQFV